MAHKRIKSNRFPGVYWRESTDLGRPHHATHSITMTERYAHLIPGKAETMTTVIDTILNGE